MLSFVGAFDNVSMVIRQVIVQLATPNQMRGRVSAVNEPSGDDREDEEIGSK